jgi:hypothetical protein
MNSEELEQQKSMLMKPGWTEDLHRALKKLDASDAKAIVDSMTQEEIWTKVNQRGRQNDYIADYIEYVGELSESAYWKHIIATLDVSTGVLWSDNMSHFKRMCETRIPGMILHAVLKFALAQGLKERNLQDYETIGCVVRAQVKRFNRMNEIQHYIATLDSETQTQVKSIIADMISTDCKYIFY